MSMPGSYVASYHLIKEPPQLLGRPSAKYVAAREYARDERGEAEFRVFADRLLRRYGLGENRRTEVGFALTELYQNAIGHARSDEPVYVRIVRRGPLLDMAILSDRHRGVDRSLLMTRDVFIPHGEKRRWGTTLAKAFLDGLFYNDPESFVDAHCIVDLERRLTDEELAQQRPN